MRALDVMKAQAMASELLETVRTHRAFMEKHGIRASRWVSDEELARQRHPAEPGTAPAR